MIWYPGTIIPPAFSKIEKVITGEIDSTQHDKNHKTIDNSEDFKKYLVILQNSSKIVVDIETTSLSPRKGSVLGIALSTQEHEGLYVTAEVAEKTHNIFQHEPFQQISTASEKTQFLNANT